MISKDAPPGWPGDTESWRLRRCAIGVHRASEVTPPKEPEAVLAGVPVTITVAIGTIPKILPDEGYTSLLS